MRPHLSVNLNKIALLRNARDLHYPNVIQAAQCVLSAGAHGITIHPRPDERHIRKKDARELATLLGQSDYQHYEFNIEGNPFESDWLALVKTLSPHQATLVPDSPEQSTSDHGWTHQDLTRLKPIIQTLQSQGIRVSLFMDADATEISRIFESGCDRIELYTEPYAAAYTRAQISNDTADDDLEDGQLGLAHTLERFHEAAITAQQLGLGVNAGHDLTAANLPAFVGAIPNIQEVSIGHAFVADALWRGLYTTTHDYLQALGYPTVI